MKSLSKIFTVGSLLSAIFLVGCGSNNNNNITCPPGEINQGNTCVVGGTTAGVYGNCPAGLVQTQSGCGPECSYGNQMGGLVTMPNGGQMCLPAIVGGYGTVPGAPYGNPYQCGNVPGTYPVPGPQGQILCEPGYAGGPYGYGGGGVYIYH